MSAARAVSKDPIARFIEKQSWPSQQSEIAAQEAVRAALGGDGPGGNRFREILHGSWLHEPLHAVMADVPVGSWTAAVLFDAIGAIAGNKTMDKAADALVILGLLGATGAAITGMNDWAEVKAEAPRKIGAYHAILNIAATGFFGASWWARGQRNARPAARGLAIVGYLIVTLSAHLGGNMIYEHGVGVERGKHWSDEQPGV